jgi:hypothetical protein
LKSRDQLLGSSLSPQSDFNKHAFYNVEVHLSPIYEKKVFGMADDFANHTVVSFLEDNTQVDLYGPEVLEWSLNPISSDFFGIQILGSM